MYNDYIHNPQKINWPHQQNYIHLSKIYQLGFKIFFAAKMVESNLLFQRFFNCSGDLSRPIVPFEYRYEQIRFEPLLLIQKLNKLISIDWYLFTPYYRNYLSHEERHKDVFLLSVLLRQFPLNSFQFFKRWLISKYYTLASMDHLNNILNDPQQNKTERTVREHLLFVHLHSTAQTEPNDTRVWASRFFSLFSWKKAFNWTRRSNFSTTKRMILTSRTKILSKHFRFESLNGLPQRASSHL